MTSTTPGTKMKSSFQDSDVYALMKVCCIKNVLLDCMCVHVNPSKTNISMKPRWGTNIHL